MTDRTSAGLRYLPRHIDEVLILGAFARAAFQDTAELTQTDHLVLEAFRRSTSDFRDASPAEIGAHLADLDDNQVTGYVNNVKGIYHEIQYVELENTDGDTVVASMHGDTNHPGTDVRFVDTGTGEHWEVQLKATDNQSYVEDWLAEHPDGEIVVTDEIADEMDLPSSGMSNQQVTTDVESFVDKAVELGEDDGIWDGLPVLAPVTLGLIVRELWQRYRQGQISRASFIKVAARVTGLRTAKVLSLMFVLSLPGIGVVAAAGLLARTIGGVTGRF